MGVIDNVRAGRYRNLLELPRFRLKEPLTAQEKAQRAKFYEEDRRLHALFRADLEAEYRMANHPKADKLFELAWQYGHAHGHEEVATYYDDLVELVK